jgi:hypothetical protein
MTLEIWPISPVWADLDTDGSWGENTAKFDSGLHQGVASYVRPLDSMRVIARNFNEIKQESLDLFYDNIKGQTLPFLFKHPYKGTNPRAAEAITQPTSTNMSSGDGFYFVNDRGYRVIPDSAFLYVDETAVGQKLNGTDFVLSQDNGFATLLVAPTAAWTASHEWFKKVVLTSPMGFQSPMWNRFSTQFTLQEIPPEK